MKLYRTAAGPLVEVRDSYSSLGTESWDELLRRDDLAGHIERTLSSRREGLTDETQNVEILPVVESQEVWAAGVTYYRSRDARMEEAAEAGGGSFYDRVYEAERPELFLKATAARVVGHAGRVRLRRDSKWNVPEPELTLVISASGKITGYTIGNDMSSRDIEGDNPLYLPQAKFYDGSCALGPCVLVTGEPLPGETRIELEVRRHGAMAFEGATTLAEMRRKPEELVDYLYRECSFPHGCLLMTGTGIIPPASFTLASGDEIRITIAPIGTLVNRVE